MRHLISRSLLASMFVASLALIGCGEGDGKNGKSGDVLGTGDVTLAGKADSIGGRRYDSFGGTLTAGATAQVAAIEDYGYRVAYTFTASAGQELQLSASGAGGSDLDTVIAVYGPKSSSGRYPYVDYNDDTDASHLSSSLSFTPAKDGTYLLLVTAYDAGSADVGLSCSNCDVPAPVTPAASTCQKTGCSGQVCADHVVITTCEYKAEYACYQSATCERQSDGTCGFTQTADLSACLGQ